MSDDMRLSREQYETCLEEAKAPLRAALRESQAREAAVLDLLRWLNGWLESDRTDSVEARTGMARVRAALASPSDAAAKLLERVAGAEKDRDHYRKASTEFLAERDTAWRRLEELERAIGVAQADSLRTARAAAVLGDAAVEVEADRDRWLGHVRSMLDTLAAAQEPGCMYVDATASEALDTAADAARRDLEQHDAGRKP